MNRLQQKYLPAAIITVGIICAILLRWEAIHSELIGVHLWRQTQTQWNIINFCQYDSNILFPRVAILNEDFDNLLLLEFPLTQWLIAMILKIQGDCNNIIITRYSLLFLSIASIVGFYKWTKLLLQDRISSSLTTLCFIFCPIFYYYSINPIPDNLALCLGIWYLFFISRYAQSERIRDLIWAMICLSTSILAKLPFITFIGYGLILFSKFRRPKALIIIVLSYAISLIAPLFWYLRATQSWDAEGPLSGIFGEGLQLSEAWSIISYHLTTGLTLHYLGPGILVFFISGLIYVFTKSKKSTPTALGILGFALATSLYFIYELNVINIVHDYYMFPFLPILLIILGVGIRWLKSSLRPSLFIGLIIVNLCGQVIYSYLSVNNRWSKEQSYFNTDVLSCYAEFNKQMMLPGHIIYLNDQSDVIFSYYFKRWGYMFNSDHLPTDWIDHMITEGDAVYMVSDSRPIDNSICHQEYFEEIIDTCGSLKLIKLTSN